MQTEDIELSRRLLHHGFHIGLSPQARSGELAPASWRALWRQRLRWAIGWDQITREELSGQWVGPSPPKGALVPDRKSLKLRRRFGLWYLVGAGRYFAWLAGVCLTVVLPITDAIRGFAPVEPIEFTPPVQFLRLVSLFGWALMMLAVVAAAFWHGEPWRRRLLLFFFPTGILGPLYLVFQLSLIFDSQRRLCCGMVSGWAVTKRAGSTNDDGIENAAEAPSVKDDGAPARSKYGRLQEVPQEEKVTAKPRCHVSVRSALLLTLLLAWMGALALGWHRMPASYSCADMNCGL